MSWHPSPPDPKPPEGRPAKVFASIGKPPRGAFDRRTYQRDYMRAKRAEQRAQRAATSHTANP